MRLVSGVILGNIVDILLSSILGMVLALLLANHSDFGGDRGITVQARIELLSTSSQFLILSFISGSIVSLFAGYLAASIARRAERLCGLLSSLSCLAIEISGLATGSRLPLWFQLGSLCLTPILGFLGGQLRQSKIYQR